MRYYEIVEAMSGQPVPWTWTEAGHMTSIARFVIGASQYDVALDLNRRHGCYELTFTNQGEMTATGTGNAFRVYSTVVDIVREFMVHHEVDELEFSSDPSERSRHKVNRRLAQKIAQLGRFAIHDDGDTIILVNQDRQSIAA